MFRIILVTGMLLLGSNAWSGAYFVCTGADGKKTFQDKPCPGQGVDMPKSVDDQQQVLAEKKEYQSKPVKKNQWVFNQTFDDMTGTKTCGMVLGPIYMGYIQQKISTAQFILVKLDGVITAGFRSAGSSPILHNDILGLGVKIGDNDFIPVSIKFGQTSIGFSALETKKIIDEISTSEFLRVRLRYWPYDTSYDSSSYPYTGFAAAYEQMMACDS
jgi:hypothetical protein